MHYSCFLLHRQVTLLRTLWVSKFVTCFSVRIATLPQPVTTVDPGIQGFLILAMISSQAFLCYLPRAQACDKSSVGSWCLCYYLEQLEIWVLWFWQWEYMRYFWFYLNFTEVYFIYCYFIWKFHTCKIYLVALFFTLFYFWYFVIFVFCSQSWWPEPRAFYC